MYMYSAASGSGLWNDEGTLYAFVADNPNVNDYGDFPAANGASGHFVEVPPMIASGKRPDGTDVRAADFGYPAPPTGVPDGPQWVLEHWSHNVVRALQFIRIEDIAYDRHDHERRLLRRHRRAARDPGRRGTAPARARPARVASIRTGASSKWCSIRTTLWSSRACRCWSTQDPLGYDNPSGDSSAGQHRDDSEQHPDPGGPGRAQPGAGQRLREDLALHVACRPSRDGRAGEPVPAT